MDYKKVLAEVYNHDDVYVLLQSLAKCFRDILLFIESYVVEEVVEEVEEVVVIEEDFTPRI